MTNEEIKKILENHKHWLKEDIDGWEKMRANLNEADLSGAFLSEADLSEAFLSGADLSGANLNGADLSDADLSEADLSEAFLSEADLSGADLSGADLSGANLNGADLSDADLSGADLSDADLSDTDLRRADLSGADLRRADLRRADLGGNTQIIYPIACPDTGVFTAWKKAMGYIIQLEIPAEAKRVSATTRKCRCNMAKVVAIQNIDGTDSDLRKVCSDYDHNFIYKVGETVKVDNFNENRWNECSPGIHFFITRQEAINY